MKQAIIIGGGITGLGEGLADGPTEVHKTTVAKQVLRGYQATDDTWPTEWSRANGKRHGQSTPTTWKPKWGICDRPSNSMLRLADWMDGGRCPAKASRSRRASCPAERRT